ncbi:papain-like cysteine peptidase, partial [Myxococcota bacterium]|nr:papain-like cysteine peptidase [Myxococcota bacterium]
ARDESRRSRENADEASLLAEATKSRFIARWGDGRENVTTKGESKVLFFEDQGALKPMELIGLFAAILGVIAAIINRKRAIVHRHEQAIDQPNKKKRSPTLLRKRFKRLFISVFIAFVCATIATTANLSETTNEVILPIFSYLL